MIRKPVITTTIFILLCAVSFFACKHRSRKIITEDFSYESFSDKLQTLVQPADTTKKLTNTSVLSGIRYAYTLNEFAPIWLSHGYKADKAAELALADLRDMQWDGLDTSRYNLARLLQLRNKLGDKATTLDDAIAFDTLLTRSYLTAASDLLFGRLIPRKADSLWFHANDSAWTAPLALAQMIDKYTPLDSFRSLVPTYKMLRDEYRHYRQLAHDTDLATAMAGVGNSIKPDSNARKNIITVISKEAPWIHPVPNDSMSDWAQWIQDYQAYMGLRATGKPDSITLAALQTPADTVMDKLAANMERVRWMQRQFGNLYVLVDVPFMQLFFRRDGANAMHMRVVVGKPERQTPSLYAVMTNVVLNPPWGVPPTILKKDVLPGMQKTGEAYLEKKGLTAYDKKGHKVNASRINSKNYRNYTYKQDPGDDNSLGYVKFNLPNPWDIYLHDTPHRGDFGKYFRALSSGCIRLEKPQPMAIFILSDLEKKNFTQGQLDSIIDTHKTQWRILKNKIPVHIAYLTAFEDTTGQHILFARDVYHRDGKLISMLRKN